jgi:hypothetical protein
MQIIDENAEYTMRKMWWPLMMMFLGAAGVFAQQTAPQGGVQVPSSPASNPTDPRLDAILMSWEQRMGPIQSASAQCTHTVINKVLKDKEVFEGTAQFTGTFVYQFVPSSQVIKVYEMKTGQSNQDNFLPFLQGMKAQDAKARYGLKLLKIDNNYVYIEIMPRLPEDKADFRMARLVLWNGSFLPRELRFVDVNGNENVWDIPKIQANDAQVTRNTFTAPKLPTGWKWEKVPMMQSAPAPRNDLPPRVIRPNQ